MLTRIFLHSFHHDDDDDDVDNYNDDNDDDVDMKTFAHQDYVDENLAAFQAQITQLQGEYLSPSSTGIFTRLFCGLFEPFCVSTSVFGVLFTRYIVARYPAGAVAIIHSPEVTNRWNAGIHPPKKIHSPKPSIIFSLLQKAKGQIYINYVLPLNCVKLCEQIL